MTPVNRRSPVAGVGSCNAGYRYPPSPPGGRRRETLTSGDRDDGGILLREVPPSLCLGLGLPFGAAHLSNLWPGLSSGVRPAIRIFRSGAEHPRPRLFTNVDSACRPRSAPPSERGFSFARGHGRAAQGRWRLSGALSGCIHQSVASRVGLPIADRLPNLWRALSSGWAATAAIS